MRSYNDGRIEFDNDEERIAYVQVLAGDVVDAARALIASAPTPAATMGIVTMPNLETRALVDAVVKLDPWGRPPRVTAAGGWTDRAMVLHLDALVAAGAFAKRATFLPDGGLAIVPGQLAVDLWTAVDALLAWVMPARGTGT